MNTEPRWPAALAVCATALLYWSLPEQLTPGPTWITVAAVLLILALSIVSHRIGRHDWNRAFSFVLLVLLTGANIWSLVMLVAQLPSKGASPIELLRSAAALWFSNILVFACWYWRIDAGGPHRRELRNSHEDGAFLFPQMTLNDRGGWKPGFVDYLFLAFNTSTAFSPTDVPVLEPLAKLLMMVQSCISLGTIAILAARAINVL